MTVGPPNHQLVRLDAGQDLLAVLRTLALDQACGEVVSACLARGISPILLKGSTLLEWLYPGELRDYSDVDLLVAPAQLMQSIDVLLRLGFEAVGHHVSLHAHPWVRKSDGAIIDLHVTLWGPHRSSERVWQELAQWTEPALVGGVQMRMLNLPARALHVVLHAAQHVDVGKPHEDLKRALACTPEVVWYSAELLADRLGALNAMASGLALESTGQDLIARLPLVSAALLAERENAPLAIGFARFSNARGFRAKLGVLRDSVMRPDHELGLERGGAGPPRDARPISRLRHLSLLVPRVVRTISALRREHRRAESLSRAVRDARNSSDEQS